MLRYEAKIIVLMQDNTWHLETIGINVPEGCLDEEKIKRIALDNFTNSNMQELINSGYEGVGGVYSFKLLEDKGRTIKLPCFDIVVELDGEGYGQITSCLHEDIPIMTEEDKEFHAAMDAIESIVMAHAVAGIDIEIPAYLEGIETAVNAINQNFPTSDED